MKEQEKSPEKDLNETEASNLPDTESKTMVIRMLKELSENLRDSKNKKGARNHNKEPIRNEKYNN